VLLTRTIRYLACDAFGCDACWPPNNADLGDPLGQVHSTITAYKRGWRREPPTGKDYCPEHVDPSNRRVFQLVRYEPPDLYAEWDEEWGPDAPFSD
jgi:hypothetical protein